MLDNLSPMRRAIYPIYSLLVGTRANYGIVQFVRFLPEKRKIAWGIFIAAINGKVEGIITWLASLKNEV